MIKRPNCKIVLLGKESTGKSCLVRRFTNDDFDPTLFASTVGASYAAKKVDTSSGQIVISLWDTAGQERFDSLTRLYYNGASAALICVDLTDGSSYSKAQFWVKELKKYQPACSCYVVVTKYDLLDTPAVAAMPAGPLPPVPACLAAQELRPTNPERAQECNANPEVEGDTSGTDPSRKSSSSPVSPFVQRARGTSSPLSPLDWRSSSDMPGKSTKGASVASSSWKSGSSTQVPDSSPAKRKEISDSQLKSLAQSVGAKICRTSSVTGEGIPELFKQVAEDLAPQLVREMDDQEALLAREACLGIQEEGLLFDPGMQNEPPVQLMQASPKERKVNCCF